MSSDFYSAKTLTAKKPHKCSVCYKEIEPGQKYIKKAGVHDGDFWSGAECLECQPIITEFCSSDYGDDGYCPEYMEEWWRDIKCPNCKNRYMVPCNYSPDDCRCEAPDACGDRSPLGMCEAEEPCDEMTRSCWCEKYDPINTLHITRGGQTAYDLAEQYYGDRELWPIIEKANGKYLYGPWDIEQKKYKGGVTVTIPPKPEEVQHG